MIKNDLKNVFLTISIILLLHTVIVYADNTESVPIPINIGEKVYIHEGDSIIYNEAGLLVELMQVKSLCDKTNSDSPINCEKDYVDVIITKDSEDEIITPREYCIDSDSGKNYNVKGIVTNIGPQTGGQVLTHEDGCWTNSTGQYVLEFLCDGIYQTSELHLCPTGCSNGACKNVDILPSTGSLADYEEFLFDSNNKFRGQIVIGALAPSDYVIFATDIAASLKRYEDSNTNGDITPVGIGWAKLDTDAKIDRPSIIVGGLCGNRFAAEYLGNPANCVLPAYKDGVGRIDYLVKNGQAAVMISGYSLLDDKSAARVLANWRDYEKAVVPGKSLCVERLNNAGTSLNVYACDPITAFIPDRCVESDNGKDYVKKGTVTTGALRSEDRCHDDNTLVEYYCDANPNLNMYDTGFSRGLKEVAEIYGLSIVPISIQSNQAAFHISGEQVTLSPGKSYETGSGVLIKLDSIKLNDPAKGGVHSVNFQVRNRFYYVENHICPLGCRNGACVTTTSCTDSDGGKNYAVKGQIVGPVGPGEGSNGWDYCYTPIDANTGSTGINGTHLLEWYCNDMGGAGQDKKQCDCYNGACVTTTSCTDSDGGKVPEVKGYVTGLLTTQSIVGVTRFDECYQAGSLVNNDPARPQAGNIVSSCPAGTLCYVQEKVCSDAVDSSGKKVIGTWDIACPNGCSNGACISVQQQNTTYWTEWFNRDNPSGDADFEHKMYFTSVCAKPIAVECARTNGVDYITAGQDVFCNRDVGFVCYNAHNPEGCYDYKVRFLCPTQNTVPQENKVQCTETDSGKDIYTKGFTTGTTYKGDRSQPQKLMDHCQTPTDLNLLVEYSCGNDGYLYEELAIKCPNGCFDGACKPAVTPVCGDGIIQSGEECEIGQIKKCEAINPNIYSDGAATCNNNCRLDLSKCIVRTAQGPLGDVQLKSVTPTGNSANTATALFNVDIYRYPPNETIGPPTSYRGFYEILTATQESGQAGIYQASWSRFTKTETYPQSKQISIVSSPILNACKTYTTTFYFQEYPWGQYNYNKFLIKSLTYQTPCVNQTPCVDTDGGFYPNKFGTVTKGSTTQSDYCLVSGGLYRYVTEYFCDASGNVQSNVSECAYQCSNGACISTPSITPTGNEGLRTSYVSGSPPNSIYDGGQSSFSIDISLDNVGGAPIGSNTGYVKIVGLDPLTYGTSNLKKNIATNIPSGGNTNVEFNGLRYIPVTQGNLQQIIWSDICYKYSTKSTACICASKDPYTNACTVDGDKAVQNSAAPIKITSLKENNAGSGKIGFSFTITHVGEGDAFFDSSVSECDDIDSNPSKSKVYVEVNPITIGNQAITPTCTGFIEGSPNKGTIRLYKNNNGVEQASIYCVLDANSALNPQETMANIDITYKYFQHNEKTLIIQHYETETNSSVISSGGGGLITGGVVSSISYETDVNGRNKKEKHKVRMYVGERYTLGDYYLMLLGVDDTGATLMLNKNGEYNPTPIIDSICAPGCREVPQGCLCPRIQIIRTQYGYIVDSGSEQSVSATEITVESGSNSVRALVDNEIVDIPSNELSNTGLELEVNSESGSKKIIVSTDSGKKETTITDGEASASTGYNLVGSEGKIYVETPDGRKILLVLPLEALELVKNKINSKNTDMVIDSSEGIPTYILKSEKDYHILGLIPSTAEITASVDAQTGKTKIKKPWYSIISTS